MSTPNNIYTQNGDRAFNEIKDSALVDLFSKLGLYKKSDTPYSEVKDVIEKCYKENSEHTFALLLASRAITKSLKLEEDSQGESINGKGNRDFTFKAITALVELDAPKVEELIYACAKVGRYKDIWEIGLLILEHCHRKINVLNSAIERHLNDAFYALDGNAAKYLPSLVKSNRDSEFYTQKEKIVKLYLQKYSSIISEADSANMDELQKELVSLPILKSYRKLKSQVGSHDFQKFISVNRKDLVEVNNIPSIALAQMIKYGFFKREDLAKKLQEFTDSKVQSGEYKSVREFYNVMDELVNQPSDLLELELTTLINKTKEQMQEDVLVVADTSDSMMSNSSDFNCTCLYIARYMAYFMSQCNSKYTNKIIEFSRSASTIHVKPEGSHYNRFRELEWKGEVANTNLVAVANHLVAIKKSVPEELIPKKVVVITDTEFDRSMTSFNSNTEFREVLLKKGFSKEYVDNLKIVYWCIAKNFKMPTNNSMAPNTFLISGLDANNLGVLTRDLKNQRELYLEVINQPIITKLINLIFN